MAEEVLKAEFFVTRNNGHMVPLVAIDELPYNITITGCSRTMTPFDIGGMTCVGRAKFRHRRHNIQDAPELAACGEISRADALKAKYFITRDSGNMVPLVAMDEMPEYFVVDGVPREVSAFDIAGMTCVGIGEARERLHTVEDLNHSAMLYTTNLGSSGSRSTSDETPVLEAGPNIVATPSMTTSSPDLATFPDIVSSPDPTCPTNDLSAVVPLAMMTPARTVSPRVLDASTFQYLLQQQTIPDTTSTTPSINGALVPGMKEYCSYWLRHGECDYQQQGCMYKHEMPVDKETLARLGLRDIPKWYREKHGLGSHLAAGGAGAAFSSGGLRSAAASRPQEEEVPSRTSDTWRAGPRVGNAGLPSSINRRGNTYNPRQSRQSNTQPEPFRSSTPLVNGLLRNGNAPQSRRQIEARQGAGPSSRGRLNSSYGRGGARASDFRGFSERNAQIANDTSAQRSRRPSASTIASDIEALVGRQDAVRKAKEDAEYQNSIQTENSKKVAPEVAKVEQHKAAETGERRESDGSGRGGRNGSRSGRAQGKDASRKASRTT